MDWLLRNSNTGLKRVKLIRFFERHSEFNDQKVWAKIGHSQFLNVQNEAETLTSESRCRLNLFNDINFDFATSPKVNF